MDCRHLAACRRGHMTKLRSPGRGCRWITGLAISLVSGIAQATRQCPPEFGPKPAWVNASGWALLALFLLAGVACVAGAWKATRGRSRLARWSWIAASVPAMLAAWIAGAWLAWTQFFLAC